MCGIFCCISLTPRIHTCIQSWNLQILGNRGPNAKKISQCGNIMFGGFVLWQQGNEICVQPIESDTHILLYNGDMFNTSNFEPSGISDSRWIFQHLTAAENEDKLIRYFKAIEGPYSIIIYDKVKKLLYFARDPLGRNSLLIESSKEHLRLLSTSYRNDIESNTMELPPVGIYKIDIGEIQNCNLFPWQPLNSEMYGYLNNLERFCNIDINIMHHIEPQWSNNERNIIKYDFNFYDMMTTSFSTSSELFEYLLRNNDILIAINQFSEILSESVKQRVQCTTKFCELCLEHKQYCNHSKVAILFSGGVDCSILAVLSDKFISKSDTIDLINVAFQSKETDNTWNVPDRISARSSFKTLKDICPERKWNFIEVNVSRKELCGELKKHIKHLIYPLKTVLDESLGCAFWFAARAKGLKDNIPWKSSARVVIVGSGADELFGGYVRHKNAYVRCNGTEAEKQQGLLRELEKDWNRISSRNLARDDRVISDSGRTPRAPFVEENVLRFVRALYPYQRCCFLLEDGIGDKLFLRLYAYSLGLNNSAFLKKRAIQFGSRIAKKTQKGTDDSIYLASNTNRMRRTLF